MEEAINDNHFKVREVFSRSLVSNNGQKIPALPIPINNQFRNDEIIEKAPDLGFNNKDFFN